MLRLVIDKVTEARQARDSLPRWAFLPLAIGMGITLAIAAFGFYWDVAYHIDRGRDTFLFTPAHTMIVIGLVGVFLSGWLAVLFYPQDRPGPAAVRLPVLNRWAPAGAVYLIACGTVALAGFPLDDIWHRLFGKDVTLWGPTHLLMIGGASLATVGFWMLLSQAAQEHPAARWRWHLTRAVGGVLAGMSTFQAEFDFGVPQYRLLYHPVLIAAAAGFALVAARTVLGRGGAILSAGGFIVIRSLLGGSLAVLGHTVPHFPLYLAEALVVEAVAARVDFRRDWRGPVLAGLGIGTLGFAAEYAWSHLWMPYPWSPGIVPAGVPLAVLAAVGAGLLGAEVSRRVLPTIRDDRPVRTLPRRVVALGGVALLAALAIPYPRTEGRTVAAEVRLTKTSGWTSVAVRLDPPDAARGADFFQILAWQGSGRVIAPLEPSADGWYRTTRLVPLGGNWKTMIRLASGRQMQALAVWFPREPETGKPPIPAVARKTGTFGPDAALLLREARGGTPTLSAVGYAGLGTVVAAWIVAACISLGILARGRRPAGASPPTAVRTPAVSTG